MAFLCLNFNNFPLLFGIKNSWGLHGLGSTYVSPSLFTSCFLLSVQQMSWLSHFLKPYAPSDHRLFAHTFPSNRSFIEFLFSRISSHPSYSLITLSSQAQCLLLFAFVVNRVSQARILEWVAVSFSGESFQPRDQIHISIVGYVQFWTEVQSGLYPCRSKSHGYHSSFSQGQSWHFVFHQSDSCSYLDGFWTWMGLVGVIWRPLRLQQYAFNKSW